MRTKFLIERFIEYINSSLQIQNYIKFGGQFFFRVLWGDKAYITVFLMIRGQNLKKKNSSFSEIVTFPLNVTNKFCIRNYSRNKFC